MFKYFVFSATKKIQTCSLSMYIFKFVNIYQILLFLCSPKYKKFPNKKFHAYRLHLTMYRFIFIFLNLEISYLIFKIKGSLVQGAKTLFHKGIL
jgi:hypothetical protein